MRVVQVAPPASSIGGITGHVAMLANALEARGLDVVRVEGPQRGGFVGAMGVLPYLARVVDATEGANVVHIHGSRWGKLALGGITPMIARAGTKLLSLHGSAIGTAWMDQVRTRALLSSFDHVLVMSESVRDALADGVDPGLASRLRVCSPFIPRGLRRGPRFDPTSPVLCSGLWSELYRFEDVIQGVRTARAGGLEVSLVLMVSSAGADAEYRRTILGLAGEHPWVQIREDQSLIDALNSQRWSCHVRATSRDSFGLSVFEALWAGIPVVATSVGVRPAGVYTFDPGDISGLVQGLLKTCADPETARDSLSATRILTGLESLLDLYERAGAP